MRRNILLVLVAALALAVGLSNVATADQGGADASAKSGKKGKRGKGKACKGNRGKGRSRGKARRSASASAKGKKGAKGKGKGKNRGCKGGGANWLKLGKYEGQDTIEVEIRSRKRVMVRLPNAPATCIPGVVIGIEVEDAKLTANRLVAKFVALPGTRGLVQRMELVVTSDYRYKLVVDSDGTDIGFPCSKPGAKFEGKLKKVG